MLSQSEVCSQIAILYSNRKLKSAGVAIWNTPKKSVKNVGLQRRHPNSKKKATGDAGIWPNNLCRQQRNLPETTKTVYQKIKRRSGNSRHDVTCRCRTCCLTSWNSALSAFILAIFSLCVLISLSYESCSLSVLPNQKSKSINHTNCNKTCDKPLFKEDNYVQSRIGRVRRPF